MLIDLGMIVAGLVILVWGAHWLVDGASRVALRLGLTPLVVGLTVVAFGTSAPELAVSMASALGGKSDIAIGNVIGSNIANVLLILGTSALIVPLRVNQQLIRLDMPIMVGASLLFYVLVSDGELGLWDSAVLAGCIVTYVWFLFRESRRERNPHVLAEYTGDLQEEARDPGNMPINLLRLLVGLVGLVGGAQILVSAAVSVAQALGVSQLVIGLTVIAIGTSLPELATSVVAATRGQRDIAVGNVVGSNIFNLLSVLGFTGLAAGGGLVVSPDVLRLDLPVMLAVTLACLPIFRSDYTVTRLNGLLFVAAYVLYLVYQVFAATGRGPLTQLSDMVMEFVLPAMIIGTVIMLVRSLRKEKR